MHLCITYNLKMVISAWLFAYSIHFYNREIDQDMHAFKSGLIATPINYNLYV